MDITKLRKDTPGTTKVLHFNNAGAALMPAPVVNAMTDYLDEETLYGGYETMMSQSSQLMAFYAEAAKMLHCTPGEIAFTDSATTAWQRAFFSIPWQNGDNIITGNAEYASNYISLLRLQELFDIEVRVVPDNIYGETDPKALEQLIDKNTRLIAITHMPTSGGLVNPIEEIGRLANKHGVLYLVDACQSVGHCPLDVRTIGCDFLTGTGRKYLRGPRGTGLLYVRHEIIEKLSPLSLDLYSAQWTGPNTYKTRKNALKFENFESNLAAKAGLAAAIRYQNNLGIDKTWKRIQELATLLRKKLNEIPGLQVTDNGKVLSGIVTFTHKNYSAKDIKVHLDKQHINVTIVPLANSRLHMEKMGMEEVVRASVHYYNTEEEISRFCEVIPY